METDIKDVLLPPIRCAHLENSASARLTFEYLCPEEFDVFSVVPLQTNYQPYCRWIVVYRFSALRSFLAGPRTKDVWDTLAENQPVNTNIITKAQSEGSPSSWQIIYGVRCHCVRGKLQTPSTDVPSLNEAFKLWKIN